MGTHVVDIGTHVIDMDANVNDMGTRVNDMATLRAWETNVGKLKHALAS